METEFICSQCRKVLYESERRTHISAEHLDYFPFGCPFCKKENKKHLETTETDMNQHISAYHNGNNLGIILLKDPAKEIELNDMIEQCRRLPIQQISPIDSSEMRRVLNLLDSAGTSTGHGNAAQDGSGLTQVNDEIGSDVIIIGDDIEAAAMAINSSGGNLPEQSAQEHEKRTAKIEIDMPSEHSVANSVIDSENNEVPNTFLPETNPVIISAVSEPQNLINSTKETNTPSQSKSHKKRLLIENNPDGPGPSSGKRRQLVNDKQLTSGNHSSHETDHNSANSGNQDKNAAMSYRNARSKSFVRITSNAPADASQKEIITKLFIVLSNGMVCFETIDHRKYSYAPVSDYLPVLRDSVLCPDGCEVVMQFHPSDRFHTPLISPCRYQKYCNKGSQVISLEQLKIFSDQIHSIAFLWTDFPVMAHFGRYQKDSEEMASQSDYCSELFSRERSILKCKKLDVTLVDYWPLYIVTNVANDCDECDLMLSQNTETGYFLYDEFLIELYEREVLQRVAVTLNIFYNDHKAVNDFYDKLRERFAHAPHKRFKFVLCTQSTCLRKLSLQSQDSTLEATDVRNGSDVVIEQRATHS